MIFPKDVEEAIVEGLRPVVPVLVEELEEAARFFDEVFASGERIRWEGGTEITQRVR